MIPVDYVTNGFQFRTTGSKYLKKNTSTMYTQDTMPLFFDTRAGKPDKYSKDFADTVFVVEKVQIGSTYTRYECPAVDTSSDYGINVHKGRVFQTGDKCYVPPKLNTTTDGGLICSVTCPSGFSSSAGYSVIGGRNIGCLNSINKSDYCIKSPPPTTFTVDTAYDMIFDMFTSSGIYDYPENMIFQSLTGTKYLLENKRLRKIKNDIMYYYVIKNSGTENWNTLIVPSQEMMDDMPKGPDVTVPQDTGPDTDNNFYNVNVNVLNVNPVSSANYQSLTQKAWVTQILTCPNGSYSTEGIKPCTVCGTGSTSTADHKACVCSDSMYFWNNMTNTCDLKGCTDNKYNIVNGKEPCTECVSGSTASPDHRGCVCPVVANGTNTWQSGTNTCTLVCNQGYTAYGNKCIDNLPTSIAQAALDLEVQRVQFAFNPTFGAPPPTATNADIQNALTLEMYRVMDSLRNIGPAIDGITPSVQTSLDIERYRVQDQFTKASPTIDDITSTVQSQLNIMVTSASKYSVPCQTGGGFYSATGFEPCFPCSTCAAAPANGTVQTTSCTPTTDTICGYGCNSGFTPSSSGASTTCTCPAGSYITGGTCQTCQTCPVNTTSTTYTASGCTTTNTTNDRTCTPSCNTGYYNLNGTCTLCTACPTDTTSTTYTASGCSGTTNRTCTSSCNPGHYNLNGTCTPCAIGKYSTGIASSVCTQCPSGTSTLGVGSALASDCQTIATYSCPSGFTDGLIGGYQCTKLATPVYVRNARTGVSTLTGYRCIGGVGTVFIDNGVNYCGTAKAYTCPDTTVGGITSVSVATVQISDDGSTRLCVTACGTGRYMDSSGTCVTCPACPVNTTSTTYTLVGCSGGSSGTCVASCRNGYVLDLYGTCICQSGNYIRSSDNVCTPCTTCPVDTVSSTYTLSGCSGSTGPGTCTLTCQNGYTNVNGVCTCQSGNYIRSSDNVCSPCTAACTGSNYESTPCTATSNRVCSPCTAACTGSNYESTPCTATSNRVCSPCTAACTGNSYESTACTATTDRVCTECPSGTSLYQTYCFTNAIGHCPSTYYADYQWVPGPNAPTNPTYQCSKSIPNSVTDKNTYYCSYGGVVKQNGNGLWYCTANYSSYTCSVGTVVTANNGTPVCYSVR
jgi:hypothetical protein